MRRGFMIINFILSIMFSLAACSDKKPASEYGTQLPKADAVLTNKVARVYDNSCLLVGTGASDLYIVSSSVNIYDSNNTVIDVSALKAGQNVEVGYSGLVLESYPAQLGKPQYIKILGQSDDMVGFYVKILNDLWNVDDTLNSEINLLAFDLSQVTNLTDAEKSALVYTMSNSHGLQGIAGTFDELSEQGYIDKDHLYFKNGLLLEFKLSDVKKDRFTFDVIKWRSGLGAYTYHDCKAVKTKDTWSYKIGSEMIS